MQLQLKLNAKTMPIAVVFHNLKGYNGHLLMQAIPRVQVEHGKYISFSLGGLRFIDSVNFLLSSLDSLVKTSNPQSFKITKRTIKDTSVLLKKGIYPNEYMDSFERFSETGLPAREAFYSKSSGKGITEEEYEYTQKYGMHLVRLVISLLRVATTSGSLLTHAVDRWPEGKSISTA